MAMKPTLFIFCGLPFSGKTTLANLLSRKFGWPIVDLDQINSQRDLGRDGQAISAKDWAKTYELSYKKTAELLNKDKSVIYDATNFTFDQRQKLKDIAQRNKALARVLYVNVSEDEARRRLLKNRREEGRYDVRDEDFEEVAKNFQAPAQKEQPLEYNYSASMKEWIRNNFTNATSR